MADRIDPSPTKDAAAGESRGVVVTADTVAQALRTRIQKSELPPGEWLREVKLCSEFGVGRSIIRRALRALSDDGLVEIEENRGARVSATTVEEVFDLYETRAALYGLAARFACLRGSDTMIASLLKKIDLLLSEAERGAPAEEIIEVSESIFGEMSECASADAQRMIAAVRRKTRFHFSYVALAINANGPGPYRFWRGVRAGLIERDADKASQSARDILYYMQGEVARMMLARGPRVRMDAQPQPSPTRRPRRLAGARS
ncbi:GntR family transcriptional regulator [Brevundimonas aveniformis]|uniref:GntR family transcriptional regulator n=1 Tax=Brevundimonas aveniformis TaxID=370977 RepID=UPI002493488D|nr:GntR family transcriptional regulator [Brevundimonas aveniformis]